MWLIYSWCTCNVQWWCIFQCDQREHRILEPGDQGRHRAANQWENIWRLQNTHTIYRRTEMCVHVHVAMCVYIPFWLTCKAGVLLVIPLKSWKPSDGHWPVGLQCTQRRAYYNDRSAIVHNKVHTTIIIYKVLITALIVCYIFVQLVP